MTSLDAALKVLAAMITPALLISASGTFILSTSSRLGRVVDRVRGLSDRIEELMHHPEQAEMGVERRAMYVAQMAQLSVRAHLLQRTLTFFYFASGMFVLTSVAIGVVSFVPVLGLNWVPVVLGIAGALALLWGSVMLVREARLAVTSLEEEMRFLNALVAHHEHGAEASKP
jgi:Protein of unknown function (DUF2721)